MRSKHKSKKAADPEPEPKKQAKDFEPVDRVTTKYEGDPLFFWKEDEQHGFLCQWYRSRFTDPEMEGLTFNSAEQYMMYKKALLFNDVAVGAEIMDCTSARKQKALGRDIRGYDEAKWCEARSEIVRRGNRLKFQQCTNVASMKIDGKGDPVSLRSLLLATGNRELVEASPFDKIWGIGYKAEEALSVSRAKWGMNLLGKALMEVRDELEKTTEGGQ